MAGQLFAKHIYSKYYLHVRFRFLPYAFVRHTKVIKVKVYSFIYKTQICDCKHDRL